VLLNMNIDKETSLILGATILEHCWSTQWCWSRFNYSP
jgi:hypothetical protein